MILDPVERVLVASRLWPDEGALWVWEVEEEKTSSIRLSDATELFLYEGEEGRFAAVHRMPGGEVMVTAHDFARPSTIVSRIVSADSGELRVEGDRAVWANLPRVFVAFTHPSSGLSDLAFTHSLVVTDRETGTAALLPVKWYEGAFDPLDQPILRATEIAGSDYVLLSIGHLSALVLYDLGTNEVVRHIALADRNGHGLVRLRRRKPEAWAIDRDTLLRLEVGAWTIVDSQRLEKDVAGVGRYLGDLAFNRLETICCVSRPISRGIVVIDTGLFSVVKELALDEDPLEVAVLSDGRILARSLTSGALVQSHL